MYEKNQLRTENHSLGVSFPTQRVAHSDNAFSSAAPLRTSEIHQTWHSFLLQKLKIHCMLTLLGLVIPPWWRYFAWYECMVLLVCAFMVGIDAWSIHVLDINTW